MRKFGFELSMNVQRLVSLMGNDEARNVEIMFQERNNLIEEYPVLNEKTPGGGLTFLLELKMSSYMMN